ncbi:MAG: hypothetical protein SGI90_10235 [Candidatus Eisenbacteria bacterium]|nr:hypothetical protein [Candidatus Eisenbacteria bacterium]
MAILGPDRVVIRDSDRRLLESFDSSGGDPKAIPFPSDPRQGISKLRGARDGGLWVLGHDGFFTLIDPSGRTLARWPNQVSRKSVSVRDFEPLADRGLAPLVNSRDTAPATLEIRGRDGTSGKSFTLPAPGEHAYIDVAIDPRGHAWLLDTDGVIRQADLRFAGGTADDWSVLESADLVAPAAIASDGAGFLHIMDTGRGAVVVLNRPGYEVGRYGEGDVPIEDSSNNDLPPSHHRRRLAVGESGLVSFSVDSQIAPIYAP